MVGADVAAVEARVAAVVVAAGTAVVGAAAAGIVGVVAAFAPAGWVGRSSAHC